MVPRLALRCLFAWLVAASQDAVEADVDAQGMVLMQMHRTKKEHARIPRRAAAQPSEGAALAEKDAARGDIISEGCASGWQVSWQGARHVINGRMFGYCFTSYYAAALLCLVLLCVGLLLDGSNQRQKAQGMQSKVRALRSKLRHEKKVIAREENTIKALSEGLRDEERLLYEAILARGAVSIDVALGCIVCKKSISFTPVVVDGPGPVAKATAEFENPAEARAILADVAELLILFSTTVLLIEGHTQTPIHEIDEFAHELAFLRAELVKLELMTRGVEEDRLDAIGLPGAIGLNEHRVVMNFINV